MEDGIVLSFLQHCKLNFSSPTKWCKDEGSSSVIAVPSKTSTVRFSIVSLISGNSFNLKQPLKQSLVRNFKFKRSAGRRVRDLQSETSNQQSSVIIVSSDPSSINR